MPNIMLKKADYLGWQAAWWIEYGSLTLILVPQVGGRIMGLRWHNQDLFWMNEALAGKSVDVTQIENPSTDKRSLGFLLWGGDKTWLAPQDRWHGGLPFLDLDSGPYEMDILDHSADLISIKMISSICRETAVQVTRFVKFDQTKNSWTVTHRVQNCSDRILHWGSWGNSMVRRPATVFLPVRADSNFPDGVKTFTHEGDAVAARSKVVTRLDDCVRVHCSEPIKFKYGIDSEQGAVLAILPLEEAGFLGYIKRFPTYHPEVYGHGCVAEVFNAAEYPYLELEIHGPVRALNPGDRFELSETNQLIELDTIPKTAADVKAILFPEEHSEP